VSAGARLRVALLGTVLGTWTADAQHQGHTPGTATPSGTTSGATPAASGSVSAPMTTSGAAPAPAMRMGPMQGGRAPPDARDPDYSEGLRRAETGGMEMADDEPYGTVLLEKFEGVDTNDGGTRRLDARASWGGDLDRVVAKVDGEETQGRLDDTRIEALWNRYVATFWSTQLGLRRDAGGDGPHRTWMAFGVQGVTPYWFDVEATGYFASGGRLSGRIELTYQALLTQRLIVAPTMEAYGYGFTDARRGTGAGLSSVEAGVRLRYEFTRQFAPYVGISRVQRVGRTADLARAAGESVRDTQYMAGIRIWF